MMKHFSELLQIRQAGSFPAARRAAVITSSRRLFCSTGPLCPGHYSSSLSKRDSEPAHHIHINRKFSVIKLVTLVVLSYCMFCHSILPYETAQNKKMKMTKCTQRIHNVCCCVNLDCYQSFLRKYQGHHYNDAASSLIALLYIDSEKALCGESWCA